MNTLRRATALYIVIALFFPVVSSAQTSLPSSSASLWTQLEWMKQRLLSILSSVSSEPIPTTPAAPSSVSSPYAHPDIWTTQSSSIDHTKLVVGDNQWSTSPKKGYIFACNPQRDYAGSVGAHVIGPWIHGGVWNTLEKITVKGTVYWSNAYFSMTTSVFSRFFKGNDLPLQVPTGIFPVQASDPAYAIDPNPISITPQTFHFTVSKRPSFASYPSCVTIATVGYALNGVPFSSALDVQGHDAVAHEVQDACSGHPRPGGQYHYHSLSNCIPHIPERNELVGYALDGFGIFSPYDANGKELTTNDLDECHGISSPITWEGEYVNMYHYVLTRDYPYTIGCFRGTPADVPLPPPPGQMTPPQPTAALPNTTCSIAASPSSVQAGGATVLSWASLNADGVYIDNGVGYVGTFGSSGIVLSKTTTYTCVGYVTNKGYGPAVKTTVTVSGSLITPEPIPPPEYLPTAMVKKNVATVLTALESALRALVSILNGPYVQE